MPFPSCLPSSVSSLSSPRLRCVRHRHRGPQAHQRQPPERAAAPCATTFVRRPPAAQQQRAGCRPRGTDADNGQPSHHVTLPLTTPCQVSPTAARFSLRPSSSPSSSPTRPLPTGCIFETSPPSRRHAVLGGEHRRSTAVGPPALLQQRPVELTEMSTHVDDATIQTCSRTTHATTRWPSLTGTRSTCSITPPGVTITTVVLGLAARTSAATTQYISSSTLPATGPGGVPPMRSFRSCDSFGSLTGIDSVTGTASPSSSRP